MSTMSEILRELAEASSVGVGTSPRVGTDPYTILASRDAGVCGVVREVWPQWSNKKTGEDAIQRPERRTDYGFGTVLVGGLWYSSGVVDAVELAVLSDLYEVKIELEESELFQVVFDDTDLFLLKRFCAVKLGVNADSPPAEQEANALMIRILQIMRTGTTNGGEVYVAEQAFSLDCSDWMDDYSSGRREAIAMAYKLRYDPKEAKSRSNAFSIAKHKRASGRVQDRDNKSGGYMSRGN